MTSWVYVDSSLVLAALFGESLGNHTDLNSPNRRIRLISSYLLEAEVLSAVRREGSDVAQALKSLGRIGFIKTGSLVRELKQVFDLGYIRGADAFHLAAALWVRERHMGLRFWTLDTKQADLARALSLEP